MSIITTEHLSRHYGHRIGIEAVNLNIGEGEIFGFLGPNGAGKTTLIRVLLGFLRPSRGQARIFGKDCWRRSREIKRDVGYLPGDVRLYPWLTGHRALMILGQVRHADLRRSGEQLAERFKLEMDLRVQRMSRGTRQKLGLVMALVHKPRLLILDEPTSSLDPLAQEEMANCLRELAAAGHSIFFSSHSLSEVEALCDRVAIVSQGRIIADETLKSLRSRARRVVELVFRDEALAAQVLLPTCLQRARRQGRHWYAELEGPSLPLIHWAAHQAIQDLSVSQPDLDTLFRSLYAAVQE